MKNRLEKKFQTICERYLKAGKFPPKFYINRLTAAGKEITSKNYRKSLFKETLSENSLLRYSGAY